MSKAYSRGGETELAAKEPGPRSQNSAQHSHPPALIF